jgi:hypothetical protein
MEKEGVKYDEGKLRWDLVPYDSLEEVVKVYTFGANKYADENWRKGIKFKRIIGAAFRHFVAWLLGEQKDKESGINHLAHCCWGLFTLMWYEKHRHEFDDRHKEGGEINVNGD